MSNEEIKYIQFTLKGIEIERFNNIIKKLGFESASTFARTTIIQKITELETKHKDI